MISKINTWLDGINSWWDAAKGKIDKLKTGQWKESKLNKSKKKKEVEESSDGGIQNLWDHIKQSHK